MSYLILGSIINNLKKINYKEKIHLDIYKREEYSVNNKKHTT